MRDIEISTPLPWMGKEERVCGDSRADGLWRNILNGEWVEEHCRVYHS